jgi:hypothetical protein
MTGSAAPAALGAPDPAVRLAVEDAVVRMFVATDERDWATLVDCFTDPFILDMTSMGGDAPSQTAPHQVARAWADAFSALDHVHHQVGNLRTRVEGDRAQVSCYGVAFHHRAAAQGVKTRVFVGSYELELTSAGGAWRIGRLVFRLKFIDGNHELEA